MDLRKLLLKDLSARLPYGVKCEIDDIDEPLELESIKFKGDYFIFGNGVYERYITEIKPYLRPMSSMTEEEGKELEYIFCEIDAPCWVDTEYGCVNFAGGNDFIDTEIAEVYTDWLNKKMFDWRKLIEKGLALEAPKGMY